MYIVCIGIQAYVYSTHNIFLSLLFRSLSSSGGDGFSAVSGPVSSGRRPYSEVHGPPGRGDHHTPHRGAGQEGEGGAKEGKKGEGEGRQERRERERFIDFLFLSSFPSGSGLSRLFSHGSVCQPLPLDPSAHQRAPQR